MNSKLIHDVLLTEGYDVALIDERELEVRFQIQGKNVLLTHTIPTELIRVPKFMLANGHGLGKLAHVLTDGSSDGGEVCIADTDSTSVNIYRPDLVYSQTVREHIDLLTRLTEDPVFNRTELLREFKDHWRIHCRTQSRISNQLFVVWDAVEPDLLEIRVPRTSIGNDLSTRTCATARALSDAQSTELVRKYGGLRNRPVKGKGVALITETLEPPPISKSDLLAWYFRVTSRLTADSEQILAQVQRKKRRDFWLVFSAPLPDERTYFAVHWTADMRKDLPMSLAQAESDGWTLTPYEVRLFSHTNLLVRGGGSLELSEKSVLFVGCGSVGSEVVHRLASVGIGRLTITDPDVFSEENLYRHTLSIEHIGRLKSEAVAEQITERYPWLKVSSFEHCLQELKDRVRLRDYDLIVIAIGSPTVERVFADYCRTMHIDTPVLNCWTEAYEVGGHATLVVPDSKGCFNCAYVDPKSFCQGLASNLNFLEPDQVTMRNYDGCGTQYLPFSAIAANQTASIAANLATQHLLGQVSRSSRVSWRGSDDRARNESLRMTYRYRHFTNSLMIEPLFNNNCDVCATASR